MHLPFHQILKYKNNYLERSVIAFRLNKSYLFPHLKLFQQVHILLFQLQVCLFQLVQTISFIQHSTCIYHFILQDMVLHFIGVQLFGDVHLLHLINEWVYEIVDTLGDHVIDLSIWIQIIFNLQAHIKKKKKPWNSKLNPTLSIYYC